MIYNKMEKQTILLVDGEPRIIADLSDFLDDSVDVLSDASPLTVLERIQGNPAVLVTISD